MIVCEKKNPPGTGGILLVVSIVEVVFFYAALPSVGGAGVVAFVVTLPVAMGVY